MSFADDGLAGKHMAGLPGISTPFAILSWPFTSALLHCEDAGLGAYNLLLSGAAKVIALLMSEMCDQVHNYSGVGPSTHSQCTAYVS